MHHTVDLKHKDPRKAEGTVALETRVVNHMWLDQLSGAWPPLYIQQSQHAQCGHAKEATK